jgi:hypothetical protein
MNSFDTASSIIDSGAKEFALAKRGAAEELSAMPTVSGPTAESVNSGAANSPRTFAEFTARGGIKNTLQQMRNSIKSIKIERNLLDANSRILAAGEKGADALYADTIATYGQGISEFIPKKSLYYDSDGIFMPKQYVNAVYLGTQKFKEAQAQKETRMQAGTIIGNSMSPQAANAEMLRSNIDPVPYEKPIGTIETAEELAKKQSDIASTQAGTLSTEQDIEKKKLENADLPAMNQAKMNEMNASAAGKRGSGGSADRTQLTGLNANLLGYMKARDALKAENAGPSDPNDPNPALKRKKTLGQYESVIQSTVDNINELRQKLGYAPMVFDGGASEEIVIAANDILSGMEKLPPKKMEATISKTGNKAYAKKGGALWWNWTGEPDEVAYANELSDRVLGYVGSKGVNDPRISQQLITEMLKKDNLEDVISDILTLMKNAGGAQQPAPEEQPPAAGTLQSVRY